MNKQFYIKKNELKTYKNECILDNRRFIAINYKAEKNEAPARASKTLVLKTEPKAEKKVEIEEIK